MCKNLIKIDIESKGIEELVSVYETLEGNKVVIGRELYDFLNIKSEFRNWIKNRINDCELEENIDYIIDGKNLPANQKKEYILTLDSAKEMAMLERNEKGKEYRRYLIQVERIFKEELQSPYKNLSKELQAIFTIDKKTTKLETELKELKEDMPLFNIECEELQEVVRKTGIKCLGGKNSKAYKDNSLRGRVYKDIQRELKRQFGVHKYKAIKRKQLDVAKEIISSYKLPILLQDEIILLNRQIQL